MIGPSIFLPHRKLFLAILRDEYHMIFVIPISGFADLSYIAYDVQRKVASELSIKIAWNEIT